MSATMTEAARRFGGFVSFVDTLKATTAETVAAAKRLNVAITIITGDALMVAEAVGARSRARDTRR